MSSSEARAPVPDVDQDPSAFDLESATPSTVVAFDALRLCEDPEGDSAEAENERRQSRTDNLTGLPNLVMLDSFLSLQVHQRVREELPGYLGVVMIGIDSLERFNAKLGRVASDQVVQSVAGALEQAARESDFLARHSGGTFCLVVSHATPDSLARAGERLRAVVERHDIDLGDNVQRKVTASFGCAWLPDVRRPGDLVVKLLEDANAQLDRAKRRGGNYVATAVDPVPKRIKKKKT